MTTWLEEFHNKKVLIWGFGAEGKSSYKFIHSLCPNQQITIAESHKANLLDIEKNYPNTKAVYDDEVNFEAFDVILKSPGIVLSDQVSSQKITSQTQLFLAHYRDHTIGITGTKGKSTTTSLTYSLLKEKYPTVLVGNIGIPCFEAIDKMENGYLACFEMSCHQLEFTTISPKYAVLLNLYEEHLDHYGTFTKYAEAKSHIFTYQKPSDFLIIHKDIHQFDDKIVAKALRIGTDIDAHNHTVIYQGNTYSYTDCKLIGEHNYRNLAVAVTLAKTLGLNDTEIQHGIRQFEPLHHRLEYIGEYDKVKYVNDSISTIGQATIQALESLSDTDVVLIGGMDRGIEYNELKEYLFIRKDIQVVFMYATGKRILQEMQKEGKIRDGLHYQEDLQNAMQLGKSLVKPHHILLLSPAASSYDHFKNFEERGDIFTQIAKQI